MKTILIALMAVFMIVAFAVPMALAEENDSDAAVSLYDDTSNLTEGLVISPTPDSTGDTSIETEEELDLNESVSSGKIAWKQVGLWFTFNQEKKINAELQLAKLRLIQAKIAAKNNNSEAMEKALEAHERIMNRVKERINKIDGASDEKGIKSNAEKLVGLERAIQVHERRIAFLNGLLGNSNLTDEQRAKIEAKIEKTQEVTSKLQEANDAKREQLKTKLMVIANLTEEQAQKIVEAGLEVRKDAREQARENLKDRIEAAKENQSNRKGHCSNASLPDKNCIWVEDEED